MRRLLGVVALSSLLACSDGASDDDTGTGEAKSTLTRNTAPSEANVGALGEGNRDFAFALFAKVRDDQANANVVVSPFSLSSAFAMLYAGARGATESELASTLHFTLPQPALHEAFNAVHLALSARGKGLSGATDSSPFTVTVANSLWAQRTMPVEAAFLDVLALQYGAGVYKVDYVREHAKARDAINGWVAQRTEQLIPELLPTSAIGEDTRFVLVNALYFNAGWETFFSEAATVEAPFTRADGSTVTTSTMNGALSLPYGEGPGYRAVALPYQDARLSMVVVLPDAGRLAEVAAKLDRGFFDALPLTQQGVKLALPKFEARSKLRLRETLTALGMTSTFTGAANFSGLTPDSVLIDDVLQEATVGVSEKGTVAAAATAIIGRAGSAMVEPKELKIDRPFLFAIFDEPTGNILFLGRIGDPTAK